MRLSSRSETWRDFDFSAQENNDFLWSGMAASILFRHYPLIFAHIGHTLEGVDFGALLLLIFQRVGGLDEQPDFSLSYNRILQGAHKPPRYAQHVNLNESVTASIIIIFCNKSRSLFDTYSSQHHDFRRFTFFAKKPLWLKKAARALTQKAKSVVVRECGCWTTPVEIIWLGCSCANWFVDCSNTIAHASIHSHC